MNRFGVENAIKSYDINKNLKFTSYLQYHIKNAVYEFLGWKGKEKIIETLSIYEEIKGTEDLTIADTLIDNGAVKEFESIENYGYYDVLTNEIEKLSQEQLDVIKRNFFNNETMSYIAQINGKSYNEISLIKRNGLNKLRKSKEIRKHYYEEFGYKHTSLISFNISQTSSTEWAVMMIEKLRQN